MNRPLAAQLGKQSKPGKEIPRALWPQPYTSMSDAAAPTRYLLWIDGVGGFYLCTSSAIRIGQAVPGNAVELPLWADLSRHHSTIRRTGECYVIDALREVEIDGRKIDKSATLPPRCELRLGNSLRMNFSRPHPLSTTARLDLLSNHRTQPASAAVLLMAETCVLGPSSKNHVVCKGWQSDVVIYRQGVELYCRTDGSLEAGGKRFERNAPLKPGAAVTGKTFAFSIEPQS